MILLIYDKVLVYEILHGQVSHIPCSNYMFPMDFTVVRSPWRSRILRCTSFFDNNIDNTPFQSFNQVVLISRRFCMIKTKNQKFILYWWTLYIWRFGSDILLSLTFSTYKIRQVGVRRRFSHSRLLLHVSSHPIDIIISWFNLTAFQKKWAAI